MLKEGLEVYNIMSLKKYLNKEFLHDSLGKVKVVDVVNNSRTRLIVSILDRGKGWSNEAGKYKGVRIKTGWYRGQNREYNNLDVVHKNTLTNGN